MDRLWAPWRLSYVTAAPAPATECIFCDAYNGRKADLLLFRGRHCFVILNLYPYNNGHLMVVPNRHLCGARGVEARRAGRDDAAGALVGDGAARGIQPARNQCRDQPRQGGRRRHREPSPHARRAALVRRHEFHDGGWRDAGPSGGSRGDGRTASSDFRKARPTSRCVRCDGCVRCDECDRCVGCGRSRWARARWWFWRHKTDRSRGMPSSSLPTAFGTDRSIPPTRRRSTEFARKACISPTAIPCFRRRRCRTRRRLRRATIPATPASSPIRFLSHIRSSTPATSGRPSARWCLTSKIRSCLPTSTITLAATISVRPRLSRSRDCTAITLPLLARRVQRLPKTYSSSMRRAARCGRRSPSFSKVRRVGRAQCR